MSTGSGPGPDTPGRPDVPGAPVLPGTPGTPDSADPAVVEQLAAALRADAADLDAYHRVLSTTVGGLLPEGMVEVDRERTMGDRMAGRPGTAKAIRLNLGDKTLELVSNRGRLTATSAQTVRGVVISRKEVTVAEWTQQLASYLASLAAESADASQALGRLLGPGQA